VPKKSNPELSCPQCRMESRLLIESGKIAWVSHYVCTSCGHVWDRGTRPSIGPKKHVNIALGRA
jgi:transposase-like protein